MKDSRYCPNCKRKRRVEAGRKGGSVTQAKRNEPSEEIRENKAVKLGDQVSLRPKTFANGAMYGEVVWIHPELRYAVVEFSVQPQAPRWGKPRPPVRLRECFHLARKASREEEERLRQEKLVKLPGDPVK
jgi:hypothetical protein